MRLNASQIASYARGAGFPDSSIATMVAIALAESSGDTNAYNGRSPDASYGLWQINMLGKLGPERRAQFGISANEQLFDPATNARAAYIVSSGGTNYHPWSTYTNGAYLRYLTGGMPVAPGPFRTAVRRYIRVLAGRYGAAHSAGYHGELSG